MILASRKKIAMRILGELRRFAHLTSWNMPARTTDTLREQVAKLFADSATIALTSFISPYKADRKTARDLHMSASRNGDDPIPFIEAFIDIPIEVAEKRDPKGLYKKARAGEIKDFTGVSAPYEAPENAEIHIRTDKINVEEAVIQIIDYLNSKDLLSLKPVR
jgi:adenylylsulfate kinase-like enzyme